ncbi:MAG TPA: hypothetical protein VFW11_21435 [Cyclobacteriaceae bacterium]|nr:hypothetical protein [Cyclobacteriaceae bacterium]
MKSKRVLLLITTLLISGTLEVCACTVCKSQQPEALRGIMHGTGPTNPWDYIITICAALIVLYTLVRSIRLIVRPGEKDPDHIKNLILTDLENEGNSGK